MANWHSPGHSGSFLQPAAMGGGCEHGAKLKLEVNGAQVKGSTRSASAQAFQDSGKRPCHYDDEWPSVASGSTLASCLLMTNATRRPTSAQKSDGWQVKETRRRGMLVASCRGSSTAVENHAAEPRPWETAPIPRSGSSKCALSIVLQFPPPRWVG